MVRIWRPHWCVEIACALWMTSVLTLFIQKYPFDVSLEVLSCHLACWVAPIGVDGSVCCIWAFIFFFLSLLENYSLTLLVVSTSTSIQIYLIFNFYSWLFYRSFIYFQFHHFILICYILCFSIWSSLFWFLIFFS